MKQKLVECNICRKPKYIVAYVEELDHASCRTCYEKNKRTINALMRKYNEVYQR